MVLIVDLRMADCPVIARYMTEAAKKQSTHKEIPPMSETLRRRHSSHWGAFTAIVENGRMTDVTDRNRSASVPSYRVYARRTLRRLSRRTAYGA